MYDGSLSPCHTKPRFHCGARELFNFPKLCEFARKPDIFCEKGPVTASLQRPWHSYGARMAFYHVPRSSCWWFSALSRRSLCTALSWHSLCADGVLKTQLLLTECCTISVQTPRTTTVFAQRPLCTPGELLLRCRRPYCVATATLRRLTVLLLEHWSTAFVLSMLKLHARVHDSMRSNSLYWRWHCIAVEMLVIILLEPRLSAFFLDAVGSSREFCSCVTGVLPNIQLLSGGHNLSRDMRLPTMWYLRPARLRPACTYAQSDQSLF